MSFFKNAAKKSIALITAMVFAFGTFSVTGFAAETKDSYAYGRQGDEFVVVVDAGHDDKHHGAYFTKEDGTIVWEETLNIQIAKALYERLSEEPGVVVYMTRDSGDCPNPAASSAGGDNTSRVTYADSVDCDLYVACHLNSATNTSARGASVYCPNTSYDLYINKIGTAVSNSILNQLKGLGIPIFSSGVICRNTQNNTLYPDGSLADYYTVIKNSKEHGFTGIIVEHAFMSNAEERAQYLYSQESLKALGEADALGIIDTIDDMKSLILEREAYIEEQKKIEEDKIVMFDPQYYWDHNTDLKKAFDRNDNEKLLLHFETYGKDEGRPTSAEFDVKSYYLANPDLRKAFGTNNWRAYYNHFEEYGINENRIVSGVTTMKSPTATYNGKSYSLVYNFNEFLKNNPDLKKEYQYDDKGAVAYFVTEGMKKGLSGRDSFELTSYYNAYKDLRKAFGKNWESYYNHYIQYGNKEGRTCTGVTELKGYTTKYNNVDYKLVYDFNYYLGNYRDLRKAFDRDDAAALNHFINYGIKEGRKSSPTFDLDYYKSSYRDLIKAFGDNNELYIKHYIEYGYKEGRAAVKPIEPEPDEIDETDSETSKPEPLPYGEDKMYGIMGDTSPYCTVEAMMAYYNSKATFPTYYAEQNLDITTLEQFCQTYLDECAAEGVKAEVAFTQAMLETNFLKYTGDVRIEKLNFAGLGAVDSNPTDGAAAFPDVKTGIRAQVQHLKVYATKDELKNPCVDPRFDLIKGTEREASCIYVEYLGQKENPKGLGWATGKLYGFNIMSWMRTWLDV